MKLEEILFYFAKMTFGLLGNHLLSGIVAFSRKAGYKLLMECE